MVDYSGVVRRIRARLDGLNDSFHDKAKASLESARENSSAGYYGQSIVLYEQTIIYSEIMGELGMALAELDHRSILQEIECANG